MRLAKLTCALGLALAAAGCGGVDAKTKCTSDGDCFAGYACDLADTEQCLPKCQDASGCLASELCDIPGGQTAGVCRPKPSP